MSSKDVLKQALKLKPDERFLVVEVENHKS